MSILGAVLRSHPADLDGVLARLTGLPGVDIALNPGDGRLVLILEDLQDDSGTVTSAAATLADLAMWPDVLSTSLVYEYSGPDAPALGERDMSDYRLWRSRPGAASHPPPSGPLAPGSLPGSEPSSSASTIANFANQVPSGTSREQTP